MIVGEVSHSSIAVGGVKTILSLQPIIVSGPWSESTGAVLSDCVMVWLTVALVLPEQSVAVQVLVVVVSPQVSVEVVST